MRNYWETTQPTLWFQSPKNSNLFGRCLCSQSLPRRGLKWVLHEDMLNPRPKSTYKTLLYPMSCVICINQILKTQDLHTNVYTCIYLNLWVMSGHSGALVSIQALQTKPRTIRRPFCRAKVAKGWWHHKPNGYCSVRQYECECPKKYMYENHMTRDI